MLDDLIIWYVIIGVLWFVCSFIAYLYNLENANAGSDIFVNRRQHARDARLSKRLVQVAPIWPLSVFILAFIGIRRFNKWRLASEKRVEELLEGVK